MLATDPVNRPRDAGEVVTSLAAVEREMEAGPSRAITLPLQRRGSRRAGMVVAGALLVGALAVAFAVWKRQAAPPSARSVLTQLTFAGGVHEYPAWSPDGKRLVYAARSGPTRKLFVKDLENGEDTQVTHGDHDDIQPAWSPDGTSIVFVRAQQSRRVLQPGDVFGEFAEGDLWRLDVRSGKETRLAADAFNPSFSRGGRIAVDASWAGPRRIWVLDGEGHNPQQVTTDTSEAVAHVAPSWSSDGSRIAFQNIERTKFDIRIANLDSKRISWITDDLAQDVRPIWSPTGRFVYFTSDRGGGLNIWRAPVRSDGSVAGPLQ
jgi:Tol biopolymer transport system component